MGSYNPHAPRDVGQEWVPIRNESEILSITVNAEEVGHSFALPSPATVADGRFYLETLPAGNALGQTFMVSIYPAGKEDQTGPIQRVLIPATSGGITGTSAPVGLGGGAVSFADALFDPSDGKYVNLYFGGATSCSMEVNFGVNAYAQQLNGKRIVKVNLLYAISTQLSRFLEQGGNASLAIDNVLGLGGAVFFGFISAGTFGVDGVPPFGVPYPVTTRRMEIGEIDQMWSAALSPIGTSDRMPYIFDTLKRFEATDPNKRSIRYQGGNTDTAFQGFLSYMALEVFYCEEQRVALGAAAYGSTATSQYRPYTLGVNPITMRTPNQALNPVLPAGQYTVVASSADVGDLFGNIIPVKQSAVPTLNALRELEPIVTHPGVRVLIPFPVQDHVGETFTKETTHILPQLSVHASGGVLTAVHVYGRQAVAPVYGSIYAEAEIDDDVVTPPGFQYPWVRFYARRFGNTTQPLVLTNQAAPTQTVSITPAEHDALVDIVDGWKEVTLRFTNPPTISSAAGSPDWRWTSAAEVAGSRWEVLGVSAPAITGTYASPFTLATQQLGAATYGGTGAVLTWQTLTPPISGVAADPSSDGVLVFAQDMPTVTGFGAVVLSQAVTGIGQNCGLNPRGIPTAIKYVNLTWSPTSSTVAVTGFGSYQMQRMDTVDTDWQTIMLNTSPSGRSFNDFEARIGILTSYRIRAIDALGFEGPWSSTVSTTIPDPGITIGATGGHILVFSSNASQAGAYNLAYSSVWEGTVSEDFAFPEAASVQLQEMYGRDFVTAFHPTERGGERFNRTVLVQAAAISTPTLGDFRSLRDMAWANLPYVCVRDEDGNRWFATVLVPAGKAMLNRTLYMAAISIIEVTDTPAPVTP